MKNVLIVEDAIWERKAFEELVKNSIEYSLVGSMENAANAIILCMRCNVDLILMDVCTADDESGFTAAHRIRQFDPNIKIIIMTSMPEYSFIEKAKKLGCDGFWYKNSDVDSLIRLMDRICQGEKVFPHQAQQICIRQQMTDSFSKRELDILKLIAKGLKYREIAERLNISENTVKSHVKNILSKSGCESSAQIVAECVQKRLILPGY